MPSRKDALTDLAQSLQNLPKPLPASSNPQNQPQPQVPLKPNQVVNREGEVINLGYRK